MVVCPECRAVHDDDVRTCPVHGVALVAGDTLLLPGEEALAPGTVVSGYVIEKKLGSGAFGEVYAGEHPIIGKKVAVKLLHRRFASDPAMVSRFIAEARAVNKIHQRNIIDIFAFGMLPDRQQHYFVMERLDGLTLGALLEKKGRLPIPTVLSIVQGIAAALDAVHEAGITHRDLKPDNVFLATERDGTYFPKLLDFGIAKLMGDDVAHRTDAGVVLGTPRYMSPEQARGKRADAQSDIYALGVMIHEMLAGAVPFPGDSAMDVLLKHTSEAPPSLSKVCADVPSGLDAPVLAMLAKRPSERPRTAGEAIAALVTAARDLGLDRQGAQATPLTVDPQMLQDKTAEITVPIDRHRAPGNAAPNTPPPGGAGRPELPSDVDATVLAPPSDTSSEGALRAAAGRSGEGTEVLPAVETESTMVRRGRGWRRGSLAMALLGLAAAASIWAVRRSPDHASSGIVVPAPQPSIQSSSAAAEPDLPATAASAALPASIMLRLSTRPAEVDVWLGDRKIGTSAESIALPRGNVRVALQLKKLGFKDDTLELTPDRDQALDASLSPLSTSPRPGRPTGKPSAGKGAPDKLFEERE